MIPLPLIQLAVSAFTSKDTPKEVVVDIAQGVKTRAFNKTNSVAAIATGLIGVQLTQNPQDHFYQGALLFCVFMVTLRDTVHKVLASLKELKKDD